MVKQKLVALPVLLVLSSSAMAVGLDGLVNVQTNQLGGPSTGEIEGNRYFSGLEFWYHDAKHRSLEKYFDFASRYTDSSELMYSIREANVATKSGHNEAMVGRKVLNWSEMDKAWGLGLLNNRQNFDYYTPGQEGLTGIMYTRQEGALSMSLFGSYLSVPESYPGTTVRDGEVKSRSAWSSPVPSKATVKGRDLKVYYSADMPSTEEAVFRYSVGGNVGIDTTHTEMNVFVMRKPENNVRVNAKSGYNTKYDVVEAKITPELLHHTVVGATAALKQKDYRVYVSSLNEYPDDMKTQEDPNAAFQVLDKRSPKNYVGLGASKSNDYFGLGLNFFQLTNANTLPKEEREKQKFQQAVNVTVDTLLFRKVKLGFDYKYDLMKGDQIVQNEASIKMDKDLTLGVGYKLIAAPSNDSFWSQYRDRDVAYSNLTYVF